MGVMVLTKQNVCLVGWRGGGRGGKDWGRIFICHLLCCLRGAGRRRRRGTGSNLHSRFGRWTGGRGLAAGAGRLWLGGGDRRAVATAHVWPRIAAPARIDSFPPSLRRRRETELRGRGCEGDRLRLNRSLAGLGRWGRQPFLEGAFSPPNPISPKNFDTGQRGVGGAAEMTAGADAPPPEGRPEAMAPRGPMAELAAASPRT